MPSWQGILNEHKTLGSNFDVLRRKHLRRLHKETGRNVIAYYSGWLQRSIDGAPVSLDDNDKNGFMNAVHGLDIAKGLDLVLHTPGGEVAATESLVSYLRSLFGTNIRAIVPQLAMSAGTMIACACKEIVMGKHSSLGPIDPQFHGLPAHGIVEEFKRALLEASANPSVIPIWQLIISRYHPTLIGECEKAIRWANEIVSEWLISGMFDGDSDAEIKANRVIEELADHALTKTHARHIDAARCKQIGLVVRDLEENKGLQDAVLSVHHCMMQTCAANSVAKIIENHKGAAFITAQATVGMPLGSNGLMQ